MWCEKSYFICLTNLVYFSLLWPSFCLAFLDSRFVDPIYRSTFFHSEKLAEPFHLLPSDSLHNWVIFYFYPDFIVSYPITSCYPFESVYLFHVYCLYSSSHRTCHHPSLTAAYQNCLFLFPSYYSIFLTSPLALIFTLLL